MNRPVDPAGNALGEFLRARRERLSPRGVGLAPSVGLRRTPGLRREEVAVLAGMSENYYTRLERGRERHPSAAVVDALARTFSLTPDEHVHLRALAARAGGETPIRPTRASDALQPSVPLLLDALRPFAAYVLNRTADVLAANPAGAALYPGMDEWAPERRNVVRYVFLQPRARELYLVDWQKHASTCISSLRSLAGGDPDDPALGALVDELREASPEFRTLWEQYDVRPHAESEKTLHHPLVGSVTLSFQALALVGSAGQRLSVFSAPPGSEAHGALERLDSSG